MIATLRKGEDGVKISTVSKAHNSETLALIEQGLAEMQQAREGQSGLCVVRAWRSMLKQAGLPLNLYPPQSMRRQRQQQIVATNRLQHDHLRKKQIAVAYLSPGAFLFHELTRAPKILSAAIRYENKLAQYLYRQELSSLQKQNLLPADAALCFQRATLDQVADYQHRGWQTTLALCFTTEEGLIGHLFHVKQSRRGWIDLSDPSDSIAKDLLRQITTSQLNEATLFMTDESRSWNLCAFYPGKNFTETVAAARGGSENRSKTVRR